MKGGIAELEEDTDKCKDNDSDKPQYNDNDKHSDNENDKDTENTNRMTMTKTMIWLAAKKKENCRAGRRH